MGVALRSGSKGAGLTAASPAPAKSVHAVRAPSRHTGTCRAERLRRGQHHARRGLIRSLRAQHILTEFAEGFEAGADFSRHSRAMEPRQLSLRALKHTLWDATIRGAAPPPRRAWRPGPRSSWLTASRFWYSDALARSSRCRQPHLGASQYMSRSPSHPSCLEIPTMVPIFFKGSPTRL